MDHNYRLNNYGDLEIESSGIPFVNDILNITLSVRLLTVF